MAAKIDGIKPPFMPVGGLEGLPSSRPLPAGGSGFHELLLEKLEQSEKIKFSAHAQTRLASRNIHLGSENLQKLSDAVQLAESKGARDSLILMDNLAFIVNVDNRTVITAMDEESIKESVFTNIDSAVIVK